jgi:pimeloyl-ACP methyl ester carboxylesterase
MPEVKDVEISSVRIEGADIRLWRKGRGPVIGFLAGFGGLPKWTPFLDQLAEGHTVLVPSLPGFPGGGIAHAQLDSHLDWIVFARQLVLAAGLAGADIVASSAGAALAAELAALWPADVRRLVLVAPLGVSDAKQPTTDMWAQRADELPGLLCADPQRYIDLKTMPPDYDTVEWTIETVRASEAAARLLWPLSDTRLARRLPMITAPTLLVRGEDDLVLPAAALARFQAALGGPSETRTITGAGHLAELDRPDEVAAETLAWFGA